MQKCAVKKEVSCTKWWESAGRRQTQTARRLGTKIVQHISILRNTVSDTSLYCGTPCAAHLYIAAHHVRHISILWHTVCGTSLYCSTPCAAHCYFAAHIYIAAHRTTLHIILQHNNLCRQLLSAQTSTQSVSKSQKCLQLYFHFTHST